MIFSNFNRLDFNEKPQTLYQFMQSMVNYNNNTQVKIVDLPQKARGMIFNFDYPLSKYVNREEFEIKILKKFMMRRIGFDTFTAFQIMLDSKLNEIMPFYNKIFDSFENWELFDGELTVRSQTDVGDSKTDTSTETNSNSASDLRHSDLPQNKIENVKNGSYLTDYDLNTDSAKSNSQGSSKSNSNNKTDEIISRSASNKFDIYKQYLEESNKIYTMIYNDLECLFYQLI